MQVQRTPKSEDREGVREREFSDSKHTGVISNFKTTQMTCCLFSITSLTTYLAQRTRHKEITNKRLFTSKNTFPNSLTNTQINQKYNGSSNRIVGEKITILLHHQRNNWTRLRPRDIQPISRKITETRIPLIRVQKGTAADILEEFTSERRSPQ